MDDTQDVKLYVYDITRGLARSLSHTLLDREIKGVWHTGIVAYGEEFSYGGIGIQSCSPGGTILGAPTEIVSLGHSELPYDVFLTYLEELSLTSFRADCYHLFDHNCNTFCNELANFMTGQDIPSYITNLPQEVLQTPFGAMIKPFVDAMFVGPEGGHALFDNTGNDTPAADASSAVSSQLTESQASASEAVAKQRVTSDILYRVPSSVTYTDDTIVEKFSAERTSLAGVLCTMDMQLMEEVHEYLALEGIHDWSLGLAHLRALCRLIGNGDIAEENRRLLTSFLQVALLSDDLISACIHDPDSSFANLARRHDQFSDDLLITLSKCVCNCVSSVPGAEWFITLHADGVNSASSASPGSLLLTALCNSWLLSDNVGVRSVACHIVSNVLRNLSSLSSDLALDLGIPLIEACKQSAPESVEHLWYALCTCVRANPQLGDLLLAMGLDVSEQEKIFPTISDYVGALRKLISADRQQKTE